MKKVLQTISEVKEFKSAQRAGDAIRKRQLHLLDVLSHLIPIGSHIKWECYSNDNDNDNGKIVADVIVFGYCLNTQGDDYEIYCVDKIGTALNIGGFLRLISKNKIKALEVCNGDIPDPGTELAVNQGCRCFQSGHRSIMVYYKCPIHGHILGEGRPDAPSV